MLTPTAAQAERPAGCHKAHTLTEFHKVARSVYTRGNSRVSSWERRLVRHVVRCQGSRRGRAPARVKGSPRWHLKRYKTSHRRRHYWPVTYSRLSPADKGWAVSTGGCESGNNPSTNTGNGFYGAFQFVLATAWAAGFTTRPDLTSWHQQAVRAVWWRNRAGAGQWPVCGR